MSKPNSPVHVATIRRQHTGREYVTHLVRRSYREAGKVKNETVANISCLPAATVELLRRSLRGECLVGADELFTIQRSRPHGHVAAVAAMARKVGLADLLGPACRQADLAFALIVARACRPGSKLATVRWWADTTLAPDLGIACCDADDVYAAMDWLVDRQEAIEKQLAGRHLVEGGLVLYDLSGSWVEAVVVLWPRTGIHVTANAGNVKSCTGWSLIPRVGRSRSTCSAATPPIRPRSSPRSPPCASGSGCRGWCWWAIVG
jgi:hypothetical protein